MKIISIIMISTVLFTGCVSQSKLEDQRTMYEDQINELELSISDLNDTVNDLELKNEEHEETIAELTESKDGFMAANNELQHKLIDLTLELEALELELMSDAAPTVISTAETVIELIRDEDFAGLSVFVHPTAGVRFTPYTYIDVVNDQVMTASQIAAFPTDSTFYYWGEYDGSGEPINQTPMDYYAEFIYDHDFASPEMMSWNSPIGTGNMINNMTTAYPTADFVEFHFSGFNPSYDGIDWSSLTLVFEYSGSSWYLVGIVHGQWTI